MAVPAIPEPELRVVGGGVRAGGGNMQTDHAILKNVCLFHNQVFNIFYQNYYITLLLLFFEKIN